MKKHEEHFWPCYVPSMIEDWVQQLIDVWWLLVVWRCLVFGRNTSQVAPDTFGRSCPFPDNTKKCHWFPLLTCSAPMENKGNPPQRGKWHWFWRPWTICFPDKTLATGLNTYGEEPLWLWQGHIWWWVLSFRTDGQHVLGQNNESLRHCLRWKWLPKAQAVQCKSECLYKLAKGIK